MHLLSASVRSVRRQASRLSAALLLCMLMPTVAMASGSNMPWDSWMTKILNDASGPVAKVIGTLLIIGCGIGIANSEGGGAKKFFQVGIGLSIAFTATSFALPFFGFSGGAAF